CHCRHRRVHCAHHEEPQGAGPPAARARMRRATRPHVQAGLKAIKKRTEDLIARENLQRDKENPTKFRYLA
ncbi:unnamed protein product, partial [Closterium sp. Naga37s-1]